MTKQSELSLDGVEQRPLKEFTEKAYLDYSMYVILDRALPHIADGLKPVQRRIVYAMSELGLKNTSKFKKSARTVGDVLGKYHPHGDSACYEAMVLMAQQFSYRYPLVDGQGNWGSQDDPKSFAAMRYTESRLTKYAELLLSEMGQGTVEWVSNFDGTLDEPRLLPAQVPNVLLNGSTGIAVGMATDIPPHNLSEVLEASIHLLDNPKATTKELCKFIPAPDYPVGAEIITPKKEIRTIYEKGTGSIKMRAKYQVEDGEIVVTALPHQASGAKVLEQIAGQMQAKKLPMVVDLRDESDHENPTRLVIVPKSNRVNVEEVMSHLFASTDLERNYRINLNMIGLDGKPQVKNLQQILTEWLTYRRDVVTKRLQYRLDKVIARLHILDGLLIAFLNIDEVINIIRKEDEPKPVLMKRFKLTDTQAEAILELKLRHLAKLEEMKIKSEQKELSEERDNLEKTLNSKSRMKTLIRKELKAVLDEHGDERRTELVEREEAKAMSRKQTVAADPVTVVLSKKGWVRCAKSHDVDIEQLSYKSGDGPLTSLQTKNNQSVVFIDSTGRTYTVPAFELPSARGQGEPLTGKFKAPSGATFIGAMEHRDKQQYLLATNAGFGFVCDTEEMVTKNRNGKQLIKVTPNALILEPVVPNSDYYAMVTQKGRLLLIEMADIPEMAKGKGNKLMHVVPKEFAAGNDKIIHSCVYNEEQILQITAGKKKLKLNSEDLHDYIDERGSRGFTLPKGYQKVATLSVIDQ